MFSHRLQILLDEERYQRVSSDAPNGGWSLLVDTTPLGITPAEASALLFDRAKVATTPMDGWGPSGESYLRIVFANEPVERLADLGERFHAALG